MQKDWYEDSLACVVVSKETIERLEILVPLAVDDESRIPYIKVLVKNTLENLRSPLDYSANFIFDVYCRSEYSSNSDIKRNCANKPQFPLTDRKSNFDRNMSKKFKNLKENQREIYNLMESMQYYNNTKWIKTLSDYVNKNKHRELTKYAIKEKGLQIKHLKLHNGLTMTNVGSFNSGKDNMVIDKIPFNEKTAPSHPAVKEYEVDFYYNLKFSDTEKEVITTLTEICEEIHTYIEALKAIIEKSPI